MQNRRMLAEAFKNLDRDMDDLRRMAARVFPRCRVSPLRWLLATLWFPFRP